MAEFKFLTGIFGGRGGPKASAAIEHATSGTLASTGGAHTSVFDQSRGGWDIERAARDGLERCIWVYRCIDVISSNAASLILNGRKDDPTDGEMYDLDTPLFKLLNRKPNSYETANLFKYRLSTQVLLSKRGAFIEVEKTNGGNIGALHLLPPNMVEPIPHAKKFISGYRIKKGGGSEEDTVPVDKIIWVRTRPHPLDPYSQITPLTAAGIVVDTDFLARLFNRNFLMNDGRPTTLVTVQGELDANDAEELKMRFSGGPMYAGRTTVIEADGITVADLSANPRDVQWLEALRSSKEDIMLAFGVPESVMGNASGRTFDNADAEREGFWKDTMVPHCDAIARALDPLTGNVDDDNYIAFDYGKVDVLQRQKRQREEALKADLTAGIISLDTYLEETGRKPLNLPGSRAHIMAGGIVITKDEDYEAIKAIPIIGQPAEPDPEAAARAGAIEGTQAGARELDNVLASRVQRFLQGDASAFGAQKELPPGPKTIEGEVAVTTGKGGGRLRPTRRAALEGQVQGVLGSWCGAQETILVDRLTHPKCRKYTRHWDGPPASSSSKGDKALNAKYVVQVERWKSDLERDLRKVLEPVIAREIKRAATEMENSGFVRMMRSRGLTTRETGSVESQVYGSPSAHQKAVADVLDGLLKVGREAAERHSERVAERIAEMDASGAGIEQIQAEVKKMIGQRNAWQKQLSTYLTTAAVEGATHNTWLKAGKLVEKVWNTAGDEDVRPSHRKLDGEVKQVRVKWKVGKHHLSYPGDPLAGPEETANCRCSASYQVAGEFEDAYDREAG